MDENNHGSVILRDERKGGIFLSGPDLPHFKFNGFCGDAGIQQHEEASDKNEEAQDTRRCTGGPAAGSGTVHCSFKDICCVPPWCEFFKGKSHVFASHSLILDRTR